MYSSYPKAPGGPNPGPPPEIVKLSAIDDATMRALMSMDCGMGAMTERLKESIESAREASAFTKKRASLEEEYAHNVMKVTRNATSEYSSHDARAGSYATGWKNILKTQEAVAENHFRFASKLTAVSDDLAVLVRDAERSRRQHREMGLRLERNLNDAEQNVERARARFDLAAEDLERVLLVKQGDTARAADMSLGNAANKRTMGMPFSRGAGLFKSKNAQQILRHEDEFRQKKAHAHDVLRNEAQNTQTIRQEYFGQHLPHVLRSLKDAMDALDAGLHYQLIRFAFLYESIALSDGMSVNPLGEKSGNVGLREAVSSIDNMSDFKEYLQSYELAYGKDYRGPRRINPYDETTLSNLMYQTTLSAPAPPAAGGVSVMNTPLEEGPALPAAPHTIFGVDLTTQMVRDGVEVPPILEICADAIERVGIQNTGIYRLSGTSSRVQKLKAKFDMDWSSVDLMNDEAMSDINIVAGCLKLWFRELPEPLLTYSLYPAFIEAAKIENEYLRQIRLHEQVNELPDANYATLRALMAHLDRVRAHESMNQMSAHNLAIVFGPTLLSPPHEMTAGDGPAGGPVYLQDMNYQCKAIETILFKYRDIFVDGEEAA
ncbi:Rho GTPase-activating protein [Malassezia sp. CBS 17886]|nr:Rho GTPase-activating protein [Malassezia sp. CBS 17886]